MKETKEEIKIRIINDLTNKNVKGISWLQKKYGIGFKLAEEIYLYYCKEKALNESGLINKKKVEHEFIDNKDNLTNVSGQLKTKINNNQEDN